MRLHLAKRCPSVDTCRILANDDGSMYDHPSNSCGGGMSVSDGPMVVDAWPDFFPANCPPKAARDTTGTLYRFTKKLVAAARDLTCHWMLYEQHRETWVAEGRACQACGVSVYLTIPAARNKRRVLPALRKAHLQSVTIVSPDGKLMHTPSGLDPDHHTWWPRSTVESQLDALVYVEAPGAT